MLQHMHASMVQISNVKFLKLMNISGVNITEKTSVSNGDMRLQWKQQPDHDQYK